METQSKATGKRTIKASEFKARCLKLMDEVAESGEEIVITKRGKPVSKLIPYNDGKAESKQISNKKKPKSLFGAGKGRMKIIGDIISPIDVEWEVETNPDRVLNP